jgi:hypothetical protein
MNSPTWGNSAKMRATIGNERRMARKPITREVVITAMMDIVLGGALLVGTVYVAGLCLAPVG